MLNADNDCKIRMAAKSSLKLLHLPLVIIRTLAEEVCTWFIAVQQPSDCVHQLYETDRTAFSNFRLVCKAFSSESGYLLFRDVVIDHPISSEYTQFTRLVERLKDSNDTIRGQVKHLRVGPFEYEDEDNFDPKLSSLLGDVLRNIKTLQTLTWNMSSMPLPAILKLFNEKHPAARLHVVLRSRRTVPLWTQQPSNLWASDTSWEQLQQLDLQDCWLRQFFSSFAHRVPNLKYLKFYLRAGGGSLHSGDPFLANFMASTPSLYTLDFGADYIEVLTETLRVILQNLQGSLRGLRISHTMPDYSGPIDFRPGMLFWNPEQYLEVLELTPGLEHFDAQIAGQTFLGNWKGDKALADAEKKWKSAKKNGIKGLKKSKSSQRSRQAQRIV